MGIGPGAPVERRDDGRGPERTHLPYRLVCRNSEGETASIIAIIKTQGSDTKLAGQMQPYYEAQSLSRWELSGKSLPPLVAQIADGESGSVMMNEFPPKYVDAVLGCSGSDTPLMNITEYLEHLFAMGVAEGDRPILQPMFQKRIWDRFSLGDGPDKMGQAIVDLHKEDARFRPGDSPAQSRHQHAGENQHAGETR